MTVDVHKLFNISKRLQRAALFSSNSWECDYTYYHADFDNAFIVIVDVGEEGFW